ncbi:MAG: Ig-like domain-containing protein [candidate division Zixibacteria bacterium]|nr:Ig-like domain-containing protein [candidate division Zixibacteria bacterium]
MWNTLGDHPYRATLDIYPPIYDITITVGDSSANCTDIINLNDSLFIYITNANEFIKDSTITVDLSQFGLSATYKIKNDANHFSRNASTDPADFTWYDTVKVAVPTPPKGLDYDTGYRIYFTATDKHTNVGTVVYQFNTRKIDTIRPQKATANWLRFYLSENNVGDSSAAIGDRLTVVADLGPSGYFEITSVGIDVRNFLPDSGSLALEDVTNGNNLWRKTFLLNQPTGAEYAKGTTDTSSVHKYIWITAVDNACNIYRDSIKLDNALDLKPPTFSGQLYYTKRDYDSSNATNLGDSIMVRVDLTGNKDIDSVWADFKDAGLGGFAIQPLYDDGTHNDTASADKIWMLGWRIGKLLDPALDPDPSDAKDAEVQGSLPADADYRVKIFAKDKSGIVDSILTNRSGAVDTNAWTSEALSSNKTYRFVLRTKDNAGNWELNTTNYLGIADGQAPWACVVYPDTGMYWGHENPLMITATTTFTDLDAAWIYYRKTDLGGGIPGPWTRYTPNMYVAPGGLVLRDTLELPQLAQYKGRYEFYIIAQDKAGNILPLDSAKAHCPAFTFFWEPQTIQADFLAINGALSPQSACGFNVWRDSLNTAKVTVVGGDTSAAIFTIDSWVIFNWGVGERDSTRIEFKDLQKIPFTYSFSVNDWPKSGSGIATDLYVRITNTRNGASGIAMVTLCVPDVKAPDIRITSPTAYSRVPIAKTSLNRVWVRAKIVSTSYDPTLPVRMEFFYQVDGTTDWVKIGETGSEGSQGYEVAWDNSKLSEGWVWLKAKITDNANNTKETPLIKVYLDKTAPLMTLTIPDAITVNGGLVVRDPGPDYFVNLNAEITNTTIDIAKVEFFISYRDSVDLVKYYHLIGEGYAGLTNSIWRYEWYINEWIDAEGEHDGWMKCGYDYKLRIKVTDIAGNVYDDENGDGQFDDYTFWANPFTTPINLNTPATDGSKLLFRLDCGAPQVAIDEVTSGDRTYQTPSSKLHGPAIVYMKRGETVGVKSIVLDSLSDLTGVKQVEYFFESPVFNNAWKSVGVATTSPWTVSFDPFALGLIHKDHVFHNEYQGGIKAVLTDSLNQTTDDEITMIVLDTVPGIAAWKTPTHTYVWGTVDLSIWSLEGDYDAHGTYRYVTYKYKPAAGGDWVEIATVRRTEGGDTTFYMAEWPTLNNLLTDGSYILGFETQDQNLNVKPIDQNPQITVIVQNALPTATITSPADGDFFCHDYYFTADVTNGPVGYVDFQYKPVLDDPSGPWTAFPGTADNFAPWDKKFTATLADGFYRMRVLVTNQAGRTWYSEPITLFYDGTNPLARIIQAQPTGGSVSDLELGNDGCYKVKRSYKTLNITAVAFDSLSPMGSQAMYNSGIDFVSLNLTYLDGDISITDLGISKASPADSGRYAFTWDISGLPTGRYEMTFQAFDKAGCGVGTDTRRFRIIDPLTPPSLVAGFWQPVPGEGKIVGVTYAGETVQFQYKTNGDWIPIGIGTQVASKSLYYPESRWQDYGVYVAPWAPSDGTNYQLRLVTAAGDDYAPILSVEIAGGVMTAVGPTTGTWGPATIERNQEEGCDMQGVARMTSSFGYPMAVGISMDLDDPTDFTYELIEFRNLPQQGTSQKYAGPFEFSEVNWGGVAYGKVFFCDYTELIGYSLNQGITAYWITQDLGTGGPVTSVTASLKDTITVTIPPEWNDDREGWEDGLVVWESSKPDPCVFQDMVLTPVGNRDGQSNYAGAPGRNCEGLCGTGSDERYAIVKMTYDASCNTPVESLMVAYWDGEGEWHLDGIYRTSKVAWINTVDHTVEFATTCLHGTYALIKRTPYVGEEIVTRKDALPSCGQYTNGYPVFWYQFVEAFPYTMDWSTLEVKVDGILVYEGGNYYVGGVKVAPSTALNGSARHWDIDYDDVSAVVSVQYRQPHDGVLDDPLPLACGSHTIWIGARTTQFSLQYLNDPFVVDCTKPVVIFPNKYVGKDPTIQFTITDDLSGVEWDSVYADVFFVTKSDSANYYGDYYGDGKEIIAFIQSFFPDQIKNYLSGNTVTITTSYNLENVRAMIVVVYNGHRRTDEDPNNWGIDPANYNFDEYYMVDGGAPDCVDNNATPHVQYFTVDSKSPTIIRNSTTTVCPMVFTITDDGSGVSDTGIVIRENGTVLPASAQQTSASAVNSGGKWFFAPSVGGGLLYYCPTPGAMAEITITDGNGNKTVILVSPETPLGEGDVVGEAGPNPFDPKVDESTNIRVTLNVSARVTVKIYDMGGDLVTTLRSDALMNAGSTLVGWNGTTEGGRTVANGVYLAHIEVTGVGGGNASTVVKIAVVEK